MPKFTLEKATWTDVEVEVPDKCPACGASFVGEESALVEWNWHDVRYTLALDASDATTGEREWDVIPESYRDDGEDYHPFLLMCDCGNWSIEP